MKKRNNALLGAAVGLTIGTAAYMITANLGSNRNTAARKKAGKAINSFGSMVTDICDVFR